MIIQTLIACLLYTATIAVLLLLSKTNQVHLLVRFPLVLILLSVFLFFGSHIIDTALVLWIVSSLATYGVLRIFRSTFRNTHRIALSKTALLIACVGIIVAVIPRYPYALGLIFEDRLYMPRLGDEPKHLSAITSIITNTDNPSFAFDPRYPFSYYYLFYLIPAVVAQVVPKSEIAFMWLVHIFISQIAFYSAGLYIIHALTKQRGIQNVCTLIFVFGSSLKIFPHTFSWFGIKEDHIEHWYHIPDHPIYGVRENVGWQISHPITLAIWTPQHQFSLMVLLCIAFVLLYYKTSAARSVLVGILLFAAFGSSAFVGIGALGIVALHSVMFLKNNNRTHILVQFCLFAVLVTPLFFKLRENTADFSFALNAPVLPNLSPLLSVLLFYIIETGVALLLSIIMIFIVLRQKGPQANGTDISLWLFLSSVLPLVVARLFKTTHFNDFSMRIQSIFTVFIPLFFAYAGSRAGDVFRKCTFSLLLVFVPFSVSVGILESYYQSRSYEQYPVEPSRMYRLIKWTTHGSDIVIINDQYYADRIPIQSFRTTITPVIPYYMSVYMPDRPYKGGAAFDSEICTILHELKDTGSYRFVYAYLLDRKPINCDILEQTTSTVEPYFESAAMKLYRIL